MKSGDAEDLGGRTVRGGAYVGLAQVAKFALHIAALAVLARLLAPQDFGLMAMVAVWINSLLLLLDLGLGSATVQRPEVTRSQLSTLFWVNLGAGSGLAVITLVVTPVLGGFFAEPRLVPIVAVSSMGFVFTASGIQHRAMLTREMRYGALVATELAALAVGAIVGVGAAMLGAGYWALVVQQLASQLLSTVGAWLASGWRPDGPAPLTTIRPFLAFGGHLTLFRIVNFVGRTVDDVLIGRFVGAAVLGLYSKAYNLIQLPISEIATPAAVVVVPALSRLQDQPDRFKTYYLRAMRVVTSLGMPGVVLLFVLADDVVAVLLGPGWEGAVPLFRLLGPAAFLATFNTAGNWVCLATGRTDRMARWQLVASAVTVTAFSIAIRWGAAGVATALSATALLLRYPSLVYLLEGSPIRPSDLLRALGRPAVASLAAGAVLWVLAATSPIGEAAWLGLTLGPAVYLPLYAAILSAGRRGSELAALLEDALRLAGVRKRGNEA